MTRHGEYKIITNTKGSGLRSAVRKFAILAAPSKIDARSRTITIVAYEVPSGSCRGNFTGRRLGHPPWWRFARYGGARRCLLEAEHIGSGDLDLRPLLVPASYFIVRDLPSRSRLATWIFVPIFWGFYLAVLAFMGTFLSDNFEFPVFSYGVYIVALSASACVGFRRIVLKDSK